MDRKENYEEEAVYTEEGEITLRGLGRFIKRAWLRTVIYLLVMLVIATALFAGFRYLGKTEYSMSATVEYSFRGISQGQNPDESVFDKDDIRSINNVRSAIEEAGLGAKILANGDLTAARNHISVTAIMPNEYVQKYNELVSGGMNSADAYAQLATMKYYPTNFVIGLRNYEELGLDKSDASNLLNALLNVYRNWFAEEFFAAVSLSDNAFKMTVDPDNPLIDYIDFADNFDASYTTFSGYLTEMIAEAPQFRSEKTGMQFADYKEELISLQTQVATLKAFITNNNVSNNIENMRLSTQNTVNRLTRESARLEGIIRDTRAQIESIEPTVVTIVSPSGTTTTSSYPQIYNDLHKSLQSYIEQKSTVDTQLAEKEEVLEKIQSGVGATEAAKKDADDMLTQIRTGSIDFIARLNDASKEYAEKLAGSDSFKVVSPSAYVYTSMSFPTMLVYIAAVVIAIAAAFIVTYALGKRNKHRKNTEERVAEQISADAKENN